MNLTPTCVECARVFDLTNETDIQEWEFGHDCEPASDEPTDAQTLRDLVDAGLEVCWSHDGYRVEHWPINDEYVIRCTSNDHAIGLTWTDNVTLNGDRLDFYAEIPAGHPLLPQNPNGSHTCEVCGCLVILFEENETHTCTIWRNP